MKLSRSSIVAGGLGLLAAAGGIGAAWQIRETARLRSELDGLRDGTGGIENLRTENQRLRAQQISAGELELLQADHAVLPRLRAEIEQLKMQVTASVATTAAARSLRPEVEERYAEFFGRVQLAPDHRERLMQLIVARYETVNEQAWAEARAGRSPNSAALRESAHDAQVRLGGQLQAEFGAGVAEEYRAFEWLLSARNVVARTVSLLASTSTPLADGQKTPLLNVLLQEAGPGFPGTVASGYDLPPYSYYHIEITDHTLKAATTVLSPAQLKALDFLRKHQRRKTPD
jgi:hypothetical protein